MIKTNKFFWVALLLHLILFSSFLWVLIKPFGIKKEKHHFLPIYVYQPQPIEKKQMINKAGLLHHHEEKPNFLKTMSHSVPDNNQTEIIHRILLRILHDTIAAKQFYPELAIEMKQTGTAKIGFLLNPNGRLSQISMLSSSGYQLIDLAALDAVRTVEWIPEAKTYLKKPEFFSIEIVFQ